MVSILTFQDMWNSLKDFSESQLCDEIQYGGHFDGNLHIQYSFIYRRDFFKMGNASNGHMNPGRIQTIELRPFLICLLI